MNKKPLLRERAVSTKKYLKKKSTRINYIPIMLTPSSEVLDTDCRGLAQGCINKATNTSFRSAW